MIEYLILCIVTLTSVETKLIFVKLMLVSKWCYGNDRSAVNNINWQTYTKTKINLEVSVEFRKTVRCNLIGLTNMLIRLYIVVQGHLGSFKVGRMKQQVNFHNWSHCSPLWLHNTVEEVTQIVDSCWEVSVVAVLFVQWVVAKY